MKVVLGKNGLQKLLNIRKMTSFRDGRHVSLYAKAITFKKSSIWVKN